MDSFFARLKWGAYVGWFAGTTYSLQDIAYHSRLTDRRAQLVRYVFFTTPAVLSGIAWISGLEIAKKVSVLVIIYISDSDLRLKIVLCRGDNFNVN